MPILRNCFPCLNKKEEIISKLDFTNVAIGEEFPLVWQHERTLEDLSLSGTRLSSLPPQLFYCQALRVLNLSNNNLESIPSAIGTLRHLQQLNLSKNFLSSVPDNLKDCRNLTHLDLSCNHFQRLPEPITCLLNLEELFLNETYLEFLPANFGRLVNLRILELRVNSLITLPKSMGRLSHLHRVDIGGNEFTELPEVVGNLVKLRELWIDFNQIRRIPPNISKLQDMQHFEANGNLIEVLPNELGSWRKLEVLSINSNLLKKFPDTIGLLKMLVTLKCEFCELEELPNSICQLERLEELVISHNRLTKLPNSIGTLRKLRFLFADNNKLESLPEEICSCALLSVLSVSRNQLSDLPIDIGRLSNLKVLNLVDNAIATLPVSVLNLVNLTSLWISDNQTQPLVPMQYADGAAKTRLTCFMLPQNGASDPFVAERDNNVAYNQLAAQSNPNGAVTFFQQSEQTDVFPTPTKKAFTRSIGFAEDTIQSCNSEESSYSKGAASAQGNADDQLIQYGPRLMRSPTPYPKELRLMAKYMKAGQKIQEKPPHMHVRDVKEARVVTNSIENEQRISPQIVNEYSIETEDRVQPEFYEINELENPVGLAQQPYFNLVSNMATNQQEIITCQNENGEYFLVQTTPEYALGGNVSPQVAFLSAAPSSDSSSMAASNIYTYYSAAVEPQLNIPDVYSSNREIMDQTVLQQQQKQQQQFINPPPYHIARNFTKKTPEDLSNYETMRMNQTLFLPGANVFQPPASNTNFQSQSENCNQPVRVANSASLPQIQKEDFDNQNNLVNDKEKVSCYAPDSMRGNTTEASSNIQQHHQLERSIACGTEDATRSSSKRKTPWLFGKHKNPTVKQVTLKCDKNELGFQIGNMDNEDGIFILSVHPDSSASRLLLAHDKLLEVNGHDFTNATLEQAHQTLIRAGGLISIMLSRK